MTTKKKTVKKSTSARGHQTVGESVIQGLKEAIVWTKCENDNVRVTLVTGARRQRSKSPAEDGAQVEVVAKGLSTKSRW